MQDRLIINGQDVELSSDTVIALTLQINDLGDMVDRQANYTNEFEIPRSATNRKIFELSDIMQSETYVPYKKHTARLWKEGLEVVTDGYAIVEASGTTYRVTVYGGLVDFFKLIEGRNLRDLDMSEFNHAWNTPTQLASRANTDGIIYPLIDNGYLDHQISPAGNFIKSIFALPCVFVHTVMRKIAASVGYVLEGDFISSTYYMNLLMTLSNEDFALKGKILHAVLTADHTTNISLYHYTDDDSSGDPVLRNGAFDLYSMHFVGVGGGSAVRPTVDINVPSTMKIRFRGKFRITGATSGTQGTWFQASLKIFAPTQYTEVLLWNTPIVMPNTVYEGSYDEWVPDGSYPANTVFTFSLQRRYAGNVSPAPCTCTLLAGATTEAYSTDGVPMTYGQTYGVAEHLPDMTQLDFIKGIGQMFGLMFKPDAVNKTLQVRGLSVISENTNKAPDWTSKVHTFRDNNGMESYDVEYRIGNYGQRNYFRYKSDDNVPSSLGEGVLRVFDETLEDENEVLVLPFAATDVVLTFQYALKIPKVQRWDANDKPTIKCEPRVLMLDRQQTYANALYWRDNTGATTQIPDKFPFVRFINTDYPKNLGFNTSLLVDWYTLLAKILDRARKLTVSMKLMATDVYKLDHFIPIYLQQFGSYFYINKVINYVGEDKLTRVELIKIGASSKGKLLGSELILNGNFATNLDEWSGDCWQWVQGGVQHVYRCGTDELKQYFAGGKLTYGLEYELKVTASGITGGSCDVLLGTNVVLTINSNGTLTYNFVSDGNEDVIVFAPTAYFDGTINEVSLRQIM